MTSAADRFPLRVVELAHQLVPAIHARFDVGQDVGEWHDLRVACEVATNCTLTAPQFCEQYAQSLACATAVLHLAAATLAQPRTQRWLLTHANPLWREIVREAWTLRDAAATGSVRPPLVSLKWAADEVQQEVADFMAACRGQDPIIAIFERFLQLRDADRRTRHGVFYTPPPLAAYLVSETDRALGEEFDLPEGLADTSTWRAITERHPGVAIPLGGRADAPFVSILDPAVGTGIFLVETIACIQRRRQSQWAACGASSDEIAQRWNDYVPTQLLPRLCGCELMLPACVIAYLRVAVKLAETGFTFAAPGQIRIQLINTLAGPLEPQALRRIKSPELAGAVRDGQTACYVEPFTVLLGNPPFSGVSQETGRWIVDLLKGRAAGGAKLASYYEIDGQPLAERKHWLQDDYVKFLRHAHWKIETAGAGVIGFVTNHGYLDNPTFRGLRQQLSHTFPRITVIDLHGSGKKKEQTPDGSDDENVFGIETGTALGLFRRPWPAPSGNSPSPHDRGGSESGPPTGSPRICHADVWGSAATKFARLAAPTTADGATASLPEIAPSLLLPRPPLYLFVPRDETHRAEYECGYRLSDIMPVNVTAPVTARDHFVVAFDEAELLQRLQEFRDRQIPDEEIRQRYFTRSRSRRYLPGDTRGWKLSEARRRLAGDEAWREHLQPCWYRPFDRRVIYWADGMIDWPRREVMQHLLRGPNLALIARRQMLPTQPCNFFWVTDTLTIDGVIRSDNRGSESVFPLYLYAAADAGSRRCNFSAAFVAAASHAVGLRWLDDERGDLSTTLGARDLFHYCYALMFSAGYRERYANLLRSEFPRIFLPQSLALFRELCRLGEQLVERHLLRVPALPSAQFCESPQAQTVPRVESGFPKYADGRVWLNSDAWFEGVPPAVWNYHVGGHQVCRKWWYDRRARRWTAAEIDCYGSLVGQLDATLKLTAEIDQAITAEGGWPKAFV